MKPLAQATQQEPGRTRLQSQEWVTKSAHAFWYSASQRPAAKGASSHFTDEEAWGEAWPVCKATELGRHTGLPPGLPRRRQESREAETDTGWGLGPGLPVISGLLLRPSRAILGPGLVCVPMWRPSQEGQAHVRSPINPAGVAHYNVPLHDSARPSPPGPRRPAASPQQARPPRASDMSSSSTRRVRKWPGGTLGSEGTMCLLRLSAVSPPMHPALLRQDHPTQALPNRQPTWVCPTSVACPHREWPQEAPGRTWVEEEVGLETASP